MPEQLPITWAGSGNWRNQVYDDWLPSEIRDAFWMHAFFPNNMTDERFNTILPPKIEEVEGTVDIPEARLGKHHGRYEKIYVNRENNIYFVPVYYRYEGQKYIKFIPLSLEVIGKADVGRKMLAGIYTKPTEVSLKLQDDLDLQLQKYLPDEIQAAANYADLAVKAKKLGLLDVANTLLGMSQDENRHHENLRSMIEPLHHVRQGGSLEKRRFHVHGKDYLWTKDELVDELGISPDEIEEAWCSGLDV